VPLQTSMTIPVITCFHTDVTDRMIVEDVIANMNNKLNEYTAKWQVYKNVLRGTLCNLSKKSTPGNTLTATLSIHILPSFLQLLLPILKH